MAELAPDSYDYADTEAWPTIGSLSVHAKTLMMNERTFTIPRQRAVAERQLGHVVFEMSMRRQEEAAPLLGGLALVETPADIPVS